MKVRRIFLPGSNEVQDADEPLVYTPETLQSKDSHRLDSNGACDVLSLNQKVLVLHTWYQIPEGFVH